MELLQENLLLLVNRQYDFYFIPDLGGAEVALNTNSNGKFEIDAPMTILLVIKKLSLYWLKLNLCKEMRPALDNI